MDRDCQRMGFIQPADPETRAGWKERDRAGLKGVTEDGWVVAPLQLSAVAGPDVEHDHVLDQGGRALLSGRADVLLEREVRPCAPVRRDGVCAHRLEAAPLVHPDDAPYG